VLAWLVLTVVGAGDGVIDHGAPDAFLRDPGTAGYDTNLHLL
jgi:hypothetical protein